MRFGEKGEPRGQEQRKDDLSTASFAGIGERNAAGEVPGSEAPIQAAEEQQAPLFATDEANNLRRRWDEVQAAFVDEPRRAVQQADTLVAEAMKRMAETFSEERSKLEGQWDRGDNVSTEDLRIALRRYRSFFNRLLSL